MSSVDGRGGLNDLQLTRWRTNAVSCHLVDARQKQVERCTVDFKKNLLNQADDYCR